MTSEALYYIQELRRECQFPVYGCLWVALGTKSLAGCLRNSCDLRERVILSLSDVLNSDQHVPIERSPAQVIWRLTRNESRYLKRWCLSPRVPFCWAALG